MSARHRLPGAVGVAFLCAAIGFAQEHTPAHLWDYSQGPHGPMHWGDLDPTFAGCGTGHQQSPIDIRDTQKADLPPIQFNYKPSPLHIIDNGHTVMINYAPGSFIQVGDKRYDLKQFHFHHPSEEKINGKASAMVAHLVHADTAGNLAVVAVLLDKGTDNALVEQLWTNLPAAKEKEQDLEQVHIDAALLLPAGRGYYTFPGSLTTPPCTENVTWFVLKQPTHLSEQELKKFAQLYSNDARPTQPLNGRVVRETR
jgi:carbonic anhydrase